MRGRQLLAGRRGVRAARRVLAALGRGHALLVAALGAEPRKGRDVPRLLGLAPKGGRWRLLLHHLLPLLGGRGLAFFGAAAVVERAAVHLSVGVVVGVRLLGVLLERRPLLGE